MRVRKIPPEEYRRLKQYINYFKTSDTELSSAVTACHMKPTKNQP
jgi:hypothetical protein